MFDCFIGIDYSGAQTALTRLRGLQVFAAFPGTQGAQCWQSPAFNVQGGAAFWNRREVAECLRNEARRGNRFLAGIGHGFSMPLSHFGQHQLKAWPAFLNNFTTYWPTHQERVVVDSLRRRLQRQRGAIPTAAAHGDGLRLTERWTPAARSVFLFGTHGAVAKAAHAGIPWLKWLRDEVGEGIHFWPFDGWRLPPDRPVVVEVHPALFRRRYPQGPRDSDEHDAYATARWMADMAERGALPSCFDPPLSSMERGVAELEGWMLGVR